MEGRQGIVPYRDTPWGIRAKSTLYWIWICNVDARLKHVFKDLATVIAREVYYHWKVTWESWPSDTWIQVFPLDTTSYKWNMVQKMWLCNDPTETHLLNSLEHCQTCYQPTVSGRGFCFVCLPYDHAGVSKIIGRVMNTSTPSETATVLIGHYNF